MNTLKPAVLLPLLSAALSIAGCSGLGQPYHEKDLYALTLSTPEPSTQPARPSSAQMDNPLRVRPMRVANPYGGSELVYKTKTGIYTTDYYRAFIANPGKLLTAGLVDYLNAHGPAYAIDPGSIADGACDLESQCTLLLGDYSGPTPVARVAFRFQLLKTQGGLIRPIWAKTYTKDIAVSDESAQALIDALSDAVRQVYAELSADLTATDEFPRK